ncbi:hypothetical protein QJQ45_010567 [Haematococcus lacustris]|nr:hypothetical protein QJQ45_010567 [Haematococcus lacustris]
MALQEPWQQLAISLQQLTASHETAVNATQGVQQAIAGVAPPDPVILHQLLQLLQQQVANSNNLQQQMADIQQQVDNLQQQMANLQQQMQGDIGALRLEVRAGANASMRLTNSRLPVGTPLQWLYNDQGQLPAQPTVTPETLFDPQHVNAEAVNELLLHYGLLQQAQGLDANRRRFMLMRHLGVLPAYQ